jgi:hypothetical protein
MRQLFTMFAASALFLSPALVLPLRGQQQPQPNPGIQVSVPEGRAGGGARQGGEGRGRETGPPRPTPRSSSGHVLIGSTPEEKGVWLPRGVAPNPLGLKDTPFQPWAKAVFADREKNELEPHTRCKPSGVLRQFLTPYGVEIVELPELQKIYIFDIGGPHTYKTVYMDGRSHPESLVPTYYGHSIGWWEGDTLVIDTVGYNEGFWMDREGRPHTNQLHTLEKLTRTNFTTLRYELTVDDPGAYTAKWTGATNLQWEKDTELFEYVCQQSNYAGSLMLGAYESVDRTAPAVP